MSRSQESKPSEFAWDDDDDDMSGFVIGIYVGFALAAVALIVNWIW